MEGKAPTPGRAQRETLHKLGHLVRTFGNTPNAEFGDETCVAVVGFAPASVANAQRIVLFSPITIADLPPVRKPCARAQRTVHVDLERTSRVHAADVRPAPGLDGVTRNFHGRVVEQV